MRAMALFCRKSYLTMQGGDERKVTNVPMRYVLSLFGRTFGPFPGCPSRLPFHFLAPGPVHRPARARLPPVSSRKGRG